MRNLVLGLGVVLAAACGGGSSDSDAAPGADGPATVDGAGADADQNDAPPAVCALVDWTAAPEGGPAVGTIGTHTITLMGDDLAGGETGETYGGFANEALYEPAIPVTDVVYINGTSGPASYTLDFGGPTTNLRMYWASFASTGTFDEGLTLTRRSGDAAMAVSGNTITGVANDKTSTGYDTNGVVDVAGTIASTTTFTLQFPTVDGIYLQIYACR